MKRVLVLFAFALLVTLPALCQGYDNEVPRLDVAGYFSHLTGDVGKNGWEGSATFRPSPRFGLVGDVGGTYGTDQILGVKFSSNIHTFMFGPRVFFPLENHEKWTPYAHLLFGVGHTNEKVNLLGLDQSDTSFAWALGGGIDYQFAEKFRVRPIQVELLHTNFFGSGESRARIGVGLVYQFGM